MAGSVIKILYSNHFEFFLGSYFQEDQRAITSREWACIAYGHLYGLLNAIKRLSPVSLWQTTLKSKQLEDPKILEHSKRYLSKGEPLIFQVV